MINSNFTINVHQGERTFILPWQRREDTSRDDAGTLGSRRFRGTGKEQALGKHGSHGPYDVHKI